MEKIIEKLKKYKEFYTLIVFFLCFFIGSIWAIFSKYQTILDKNEKMLETIETTQQMSLKSVIWNDQIPIGERASACDVYLNAGYNSLTKKHCESILKGVE